MPERGKTFIPIFCAGVILMLYTEFQYPTLSGTGQKVCVGMIANYMLQHRAMDMDWIYFL